MGTCTSYCRTQSKRGRVGDGGMYYNNGVLQLTCSHCAILSRTPYRLQRPTDRNPPQAGQPPGSHAPWGRVHVRRPRSAAGLGVVDRSIDERCRDLKPQSEFGRTIDWVGGSVIPGQYRMDLFNTDFICSQPYHSPPLKKEPARSPIAIALPSSFKKNKKKLSQVAIFLLQGTSIRFPFLPSQNSGIPNRFLHHVQS